MPHKKQEPPPTQPELQGETQGLSPIHRGTAPKVEDYTPFGRFLITRVRARGMTIESLLRQVNKFSYTKFNELCRGKIKAFPPMTAYRFAEVLEVNPVAFQVMYLQNVEYPEDINWEDPDVPALSFQLLYDHLVFYHRVLPRNEEDLMEYDQMLWGRLPMREKQAAIDAAAYQAHPGKYYYYAHKKWQRKPKKEESQEAAPVAKE